MCVFIFSVTLNIACSFLLGKYDLQKLIKHVYRDIRCPNPSLYSTHSFTNYLAKNTHLSPQRLRKPPPHAIPSLVSVRQGRQSVLETKRIIRVVFSLFKMI
ncbi:hypothetical protein QVD17_35185 [Tagetes erecta]|uniref:Secreted protein n=1 Tax=Tagetes erecta TaxID=13708 RepID=A0AAD8K355_TARER|nr:hypothetical protein QVD17_35185 [Tagetes erecta]